MKITKNLFVLTTHKLVVLKEEKRRDDKENHIVNKEGKLNTFRITSLQDRATKRSAE